MLHHVPVGRGGGVSRRLFAAILDRIALLSIPLLNAAGCPGYRKVRSKSLSERNLDQRAIEEKTKKNAAKTN